MYAIVRTGGKQAKVQPGDVIDVELVRSSGDEVELTPLLVVDDDGTVHSGREAMKGIKVQARVVGQGAGAKVDIFKYKAKTGYRRRQGHRQKFTTIEVTDIVLPGAPKKAEKAEKAEKAQKPTKAGTKVAVEAPDSGADKPPDTNLEKAPAAKAPAAKKSPAAAKKQASAEADPKEA